MKKLLLFLLFSGSLDSFSQVPDTTVPLREYNWSGPRPVSTTDTLRALILVTTSANGFGRSRMGYVVLQTGKKVIYLDCRKRALRLPMVGWGYIEVKEKLKQ